MHRSRIGIVLVDHPGDHHDEALAFWAGAQGVSAVAEEGPYSSVGQVGSLDLAVQRLDDGQPRVHLDIESDDVAAEVARLEALGASVVDRRDDYAIMADPGGVVFCVVGVQTGDRFHAEAREWP